MLLISFTSAVTIGNGTITNSSSGGQLTFLQDTSMDVLNVTATHTNIYNLTTDGAGFNNSGFNKSNLGIYGLTDGLVIMANGTICGSTNINLNDGNINCSFSKGNITRVFPEYNLTDGQTRVNSPLTMSGTGKVRSITSSISQSLTVDVIVTVTSCLSSLAVTSTGGYSTKSCISATQILLQGVVVDSGGETITIGDGSPPNAFSSTFVLLMGGFGGLISIVIIMGIIRMFLEGKIPLKTFIKTLMIAIIMFLIAGFIVVLGVT